MTRRRPFLLALPAVLLVLVVLALVAAPGLRRFAVPDARPDARAASEAAEPPQTVATVVAAAETWQPTIEAVGNLRALDGADLAFETAGIVDAISFGSGASVRRGMVLARLRLDDEPARLDQARAQADLAAVNLARDEKQFAAQAVSHAALDQDRATLLADRAAAASIEALIAEKTLVAPFDGTLGVRQVDLGQYLQPGTKVVTLQALDPIAADVFVPEADLARVRGGEAGHLAVAAWPGRDFAARVSALTPQVDQASRTVLVRALVPNADHALLPGMFATLRLVAGAPVAHLTLPQTAISYATYGSTVFVVTTDAHGRAVAHQRLVRPGEQRGDQIAVLAGIAAGDVVVSAGQLKLHDGTAVVVDNSVRPDGSADPHPPQE